MVRFAKVLLAVLIFNIGTGLFNVLPFYTVNGTSYTLTYRFKQPNQYLLPGTVLNTVGCSTTAGSATCTAPAALSSPGLLAYAGVFGWFVGALYALYAVAFAPAYMYNTIVNFGLWWGFAALIAGGLGIIYWYTLLLIISGRYFED